MALRRLQSNRIYLLALVEPMIAAAAYVAATFIHSPIDAQIYLMYDEGGVQVALVAALYIIAGYFFDFHKRVRLTSPLVVMLQIANLIGVVLMMQAAIAFTTRDLVPSQSIVLTGSAIIFVAFTGWRLFVRPALWNVVGAQTALIVGLSPAAVRLCEAFDQEPTLGVRAVGHVGEGTPPASVPQLGRFPDLRKIVASVKPDRIIVSAEKLSDTGMLKTLFELRVTGISVESAGDVYEAIFGRVYSDAVEPYTVIFRNELSAPPGIVALQSIYTNVIGLAAAVVLLPLLAAIVLLLRMTRGGPVLVKQCCIGLHGIPFNRYTIRCGNDHVGRMLLRLRLYALPQVLNVVRGEMALIGPRPERLEFSLVLRDLIPFYAQKQSVKPGILGWSQLYCDAMTTEDTLARIEYDLYYIKHISLVLDAYIVLRALKAVFAPEQESRLHVETGSAAA
jgi:lipopolysaccharide/colanic/teichoic acid biosynthesis glycosyltransferase